MERLKNLFFLIIGLIIVIWSFYTFLNKPAPAKYQTAITTHTLRVGNYVLPIEIADTEAAREQGFSGRERPESGHGLLFIFETPGMYGFWMKEMRFAIDIVWIGDNWEVVGVARDVLPESFPNTFSPPTPVRYVLELPAGDTAAFGIDTGSKLYLDQ